MVVAKPVDLRARAAQDIETAVDYCATEAGEDVTLRFISELDEAFEHLADYPQSGSLQWSHELGIPELRSWPLQRFPYVVFYVERPSAIDAWRIIHARRDMPASFASPG